MEVADGAAEGGLNLSVVCGCDLEPLADARRERHVDVVVHNQAHERWLRATLWFQAGEADLADGEGIEVGKQQFAVAEVEPWGLDRARDQFGLVLEVMAVMRGVAGAVSEDERALAAASSTGIRVIALAHEMSFTEEDLEGMPKIAREHVKRYSYMQRGKYFLPMDNERFLNHSKENNLDSLFTADKVYQGEITNRGIKKGEELTVDYSKFDDKFTEEF